MSGNRKAIMQCTAYELGMTRKGEDNRGLHTLVEDFDLFRLGRRRRITNLLYQADAFLDGHPVLSFR